MAPNPTQYLTDYTIRQITLTTQVIARYGMQEDFNMPLTQEDRDNIDTIIGKAAKEINTILYKRLS